MELRSMKRRQLQALCKKHGIPANLTNLEMADRLSSILKVQEKSNEPDAQEESAASDLGGYKNEMDAKEGPCIVKKVRFSPDNETFIFVSSNVKTSMKPKPTTRGSLAKKASLKHIDGPGRSTWLRAQGFAKKGVAMDVFPMLEAKRMRRSKGHNFVESGVNNQGRLDGAVDVEDHWTQLENIVPKKRTEEEPFNRSKSIKNIGGHFVALPEISNSSVAHQRDQGIRRRKKLEPRKKKDEALVALDKKPEEIKISGRVTRTRSRMIRDTSLAVAVISDAETQGEDGQFLPKEVPAKDAPENFKKLRITRRNLQIETLVDPAQGKSHGIKSCSSTLSMESVKLQTVEPTVDPAYKDRLRRSKRKPPLSAVQANENSPVDAVDRLILSQKEEDRVHVKATREIVTKVSTVDIGQSYEEPLRGSGSHPLNAVQLDPAEVSSETIGKKLETGSGAFISDEVSSITLPSEARSSLPGRFDHIKKLEMKNPPENSEVNFDGEKAGGPKTASKGGFVNRKIQELSSHVAVGTEELNSCSEDREISSLDEGFEAVQFSMMKNDCSTVTTEHDHRDYWNGDRVSEKSMLTPADKVDNHHPNEEESTYSCKATRLQARNSALQTKASRIAVEEAFGPGSQNNCPTPASFGQRNLKGPEFDLGRMEVLNEGLCSERDGDDMQSEKYNQIDFAEAISNHDRIQAVEPLMAVLHMDASNANLRNLSPGRNSVSTKQYEAQSSCQQDNHPQRSDYSSNQKPKDSWNEFVGDVTSAAERRREDTTNRQRMRLHEGTPILTESQFSYEPKREGSGTRSLNLHFHQGETDGGILLTPWTVPDACLNQGSEISDKMTDLSSIGISGLFDHMVGSGDTEACGHDHTEKVAADAHGHSLIPTEASIHRQKHLGTKYEDDIDCSGGLCGGQCGDALKVNDVQPCSDIEPCGDYHPRGVAADPNVENFSYAETSIYRQKYTGKKREQGIMEEFSAHTQALGSMMGKTGGSVLHNFSNKKKPNNSGQEDMRKHGHDQIDLEANFAGLDKESVSIEASRDCISWVQTAISGSPHSNAEKLSSKASKSVRLPEQDIHQCMANTSLASFEGSFEADKTMEMLKIGENKLKMATPKQNVVISKDDLNSTSPSSPKSLKSKSFTSQNVNDITDLVDEESEWSGFSKRITGFQENYAESTFQIDQNASSTVVKLEAKLTSSATLSEDIQRSLRASVEDARWLETALLDVDDTYDCSVECADSSSNATQHEATEEAHGINVQENNEIMTIKNALILVADSQHGINAGHATENPSNAPTRYELGLEDSKRFAVEDLRPLFGGEEPQFYHTVQNLCSNPSQKIEEGSVELKITGFPKNAEENEVGAENTNFMYGLEDSENQPRLPCVERKSDGPKEANADNGSPKLADEVKDSDLLVESRSPHMRIGCSPVLSLANFANQDCKLSDGQVENPTFTCEMSPLHGDCLVLDDARNKSMDDQNIRFESQNVVEESIQQLKVQEATGAEEISNDVGIATSSAEKQAFADDFPAKNIKRMMEDQEASASAMIQEYMDREEEDETRRIMPSIWRNDDRIFPYSEEDYLPACVLFSENRDFIAVGAVQDTRKEQLQVHNADSKQHDRSSKQTGWVDVTETPTRTAPKVSDMKENTGNIKTTRAPTTAASKTRMKRRALEVLPNE